MLNGNQYRAEEISGYMLMLQRFRQNMFPRLRKTKDYNHKTEIYPRSYDFLGGSLVPANVQSDLTEFQLHDEFGIDCYRRISNQGEFDYTSKNCMPISDDDFDFEEFTTKKDSYSPFHTPDPLHDVTGFYTNYTVMYLMNVVLMEDL